MNTLEVVQQIYAAFGRGDVAGIMEHIAENVEWDTEQVGAVAEVPWLKPRRGRTEVQGFFTDLATEVDIQKFEPRGFFASPDGRVVAMFSMAGVVRRTGKRVEDTADTHVWTFDERGRVVSMRHLVDSWQHVTAWRG